MARREGDPGTRTNPIAIDARPKPNVKRGKRPVPFEMVNADRCRVSGAVKIEKLNVGECVVVPYSEGFFFIRHVKDYDLGGVNMKFRSIRSAKGMKIYRYE